MTGSACTVPEVKRSRSPRLPNALTASVCRLMTAYVSSWQLWPWAWLDWVKITMMVYRAESQIRRIRLSSEKMTHVHLCSPGSIIYGTGQMVVMLYGWEGNRRFGVTLTMRHRLLWFIHQRALSLKGAFTHTLGWDGMGCAGNSMCERLHWNS